MNSSQVAELQTLLETRLVPEMMGELSFWDGCGDIADWVSYFLRDNGYRDAWRPITDGHAFALVDNNSLIVDLWEWDGSLKVKIFHSDYGKTDHDYIWWDAADTPEEEELLERKAKELAGLCSNGRQRCH